MRKIYIGETLKANLEKRAMLVESECFKDVTYAIDRRGRGLYLLVDGKEVAICEPDMFANELMDVWNMHRRGNSSENNQSQGEKNRA